MGQCRYIADSLKPKAMAKLSIGKPVGSLHGASREERSGTSHSAQSLAPAVDVPEIARVQQARQGGAGVVDGLGGSKRRVATCGPALRRRMRRGDSSTAGTGVAVTLQRGPGAGAGRRVIVRRVGGARPRLTRRSRYTTNGVEESGRRAHGPAALATLSLSAIFVQARACPSASTVHLKTRFPSCFLPVHPRRRDTSLGAHPPA